VCYLHFFWCNGMKEKRHTHFVCQACGHQSSKWMGRCPQCTQWNTLVEEKKVEVGRGRNGLLGTGIGGEKGEAPQPIDHVEMSENDRISTGIGEFDRVLGGG
jgi:DNA repair protein RadA/Sms